MAATDLPIDVKKQVANYLRAIIKNINNQSPTFFEFVKPTLDEFTNSIEKIKKRLKAQEDNLKINMNSYFGKYLRAISDNILKQTFPAYNLDTPHHIDIRKSYFKTCFAYLQNSTFNYELQQIIENLFKKTKELIWS